MQVEHIPFSNNVSCLIKSVRPDSGAAPLGEVTDLVGAGPGVPAMDLLGPAAPILQPSPPFHAAADHLGDPGSSFEQEAAGISIDASSSLGSGADTRPAPGWLQQGNPLGGPSPAAHNPDSSTTPLLSNGAETSPHTQQEAQEQLQQQQQSLSEGTGTRKRTAAAMEVDSQGTATPGTADMDTQQGDGSAEPSPSHPHPEDGRPPATAADTPASAFDPSVHASGLPNGFLPPPQPPPQPPHPLQPASGPASADAAAAAAGTSTSPAANTSPASADAGSATAAPSASAPPAAAAAAAAGVPAAGAAAGSSGGGMVADVLAVELHQIVTTRSGGVSEVGFAGRLAALVEGEERLGGRLTLLSVVQQSSQEVLRAFVQGSGLRSLERWVVQFRDEHKHQPLVSVIGCLKMLPIDLTALKGSNIGQTVGKLRKHTNPLVRGAASELVEQWKGVVDRSVGKGEARQGLKSKADSASQEGPNKRAKRAEQPTSAGGNGSGGVAAATAKQAAGGGAGGAEAHPGGSAANATTTTTTTSKLAVMDDDLFVGGAGGGTPAAPAHPHKSLTSFVTAKKVHPIKLENVQTGRLGGGAAAQGAAGSAAAAPGHAGAAGGDGDAAGGALSPTSSGDAAAAAAAAEAGAAGSDAAASTGQDASTPGGIGGADTVATLLPLGSGADGAPAGPSGAAATGVPKPVTLPRLGTLSGPSAPTVRLGSLRDSSLPTAGIARLGAAGGGAGGVGGRVGAAASLPAAVAPGGPQSAHARAMAARARAPSPEPAPRKEKRKTVSWAGDDALASYRLFRKDDPPQLAATDATLSAEDAAAAAASPDASTAGPGGGAAPGVGGGHSGGLLAPPGFQSAARREHASERMAIAAQHEQEELERQLELERWTALRPTVPWTEPPELYLGAIPAQQLPGQGEESTEREVQAHARQRTPRVVYYSPSTIPPTPAEPPHEPEPDFYRVRHIPLNVPGVAPAVGGIAGVLPPPAVGGMLQPGMYGPGGQAPPPSHQQQQPAAAVVVGARPGVPPPYGGAPGQPPVVAQQQQPAGGPPGTLTLSPDLVASLPGLISSLSQQQQQQQPGQQQPPQPPLQQHVPGPQPGQGPPPPAHVLPHPHPLPMSHPQPHGANPNPRLVGGPVAQQQQPGHQPLLPPGAPPGGGPIPYGGPAPAHPGPMGPGPGGVPPGPGGRPGSRFEAGPGQGPGPGGGGPPPPPPRKEGQPTLMRPRRSDDPPGPVGSGMPLGPPHPHHSHPPHIMGPGIGMRHPGPHPHSMQGGQHAMAGGWAPSGPPGGGPPSSKVCAYFNTPGGCRNGDGCRFLHLLGGQDGGPAGQYDGGPYSGHGPGRGGMAMGRMGGPPGMPGGGVRRR